VFEVDFENRVVKRLVVPQFFCRRACTRHRNPPWREEECTVSASG
jgi:hypothetical protein